MVPKRALLLTGNLVILWQGILFRKVKPGWNKASTEEVGAWMHPRPKSHEKVHNLNAQTTKPPYLPLLQKQPDPHQPGDQKNFLKIWPAKEEHNPRVGISPRSTDPHKNFLDKTSKAVFLSSHSRTRKSLKLCKKSQRLKKNKSKQVKKRGKA